MSEITVGHEQRDLLRGPQAGEEAELIVVALSLAPVAMDRGDQDFRLLDGERVNDGTVFLRVSQAL